MIETLIAIISGACGIGLTAVWNAWVGKRKDMELETWKIRVAELEKRLSQFYWPIYIRLQRDNVVWQRLSERDNRTDVDHRQLGFQIEDGVLLPNHAEIVSIIETNVHLAALDKDFEVEVLAYLRHIDVYRSIRSVGIKDKDPLYFGEPWPTRFFPMLEERLRKYQSEYERALRMQGIG